MPHEPPLPYGLAHGWIVLDETHLIRPTTTQGGEPYGFIEAHRRGDGQWCGGSLTRRGMGGGTRPEWDVLSEDPLTLDPSILCNPARGGCGEHGWVRSGTWVPA